MRLDLYITKHFGVQSRNKASELIKLRKIIVNGKIIGKPSYKVEVDDDIKINQDEFYVSRAAYKLKYFLEEFNIDIKDHDCVDIGSSTGGFTQISLQKGVSSITCVDVGSNQLHKSLKNDPRIIIQENTDIRKFFPNITYDLVACDVSFISILMILDDIARLAKDKIIILYKPQFEVGREVKRDSNGVVQDIDAVKKCKEEFLEKTKNYGWRLVNNQQSQVAGKSGNVEELFYFTV